MFFGMSEYIITTASIFTKRKDNGMEQILYADILFMINFSMDFITLYLTSRLTSGPPSGYRTALSAASGGIYATLATALGIYGTASVLTAGIVSAVMVLIAFGYGSGTMLLRRTAVFWGLAMLLGGAMSAICSLGNNDFPGNSPSGETTVLFAGTTLCLLFVKAIAHFKKRKVVSVKVTLSGKSTVFEALCDSGNLISDPLSGTSVIIADSSVVKQIAPELCTSPSSIPDYLSTKIRMIPVTGVGGGGLLTGFVPDLVSVTDNKKEKKCSAIIAISDIGKTFFGGYPANIPMSLL